MINSQKKHVFVGMSGGIDSSATLKLLLDQGYKVTGITFVGLGKETPTLRQGKANLITSRKCCSAEEVILAKKICFHLGISHITLDLTDLFQKMVKDPFAQSYLKGETPNPCMLCNRYVKLGALVDYALEQGADYFATGHYTGIEHIDGEYLLKAGKDIQKDQSYFLALLKPETLPYLLFPLADKEKKEVRELIQSSDLPIASNKIESQDLCFIDTDYRDYLRQQGITSKPGDIIYQSQKVGTHEGVAFYALGQRKGLGIAIGQKAFIREINSNQIIIGDKPKSNVFFVEDLNIFSTKFQNGIWDVQTRYRSSRVSGTITFINDRTIKVVLEKPQEIVAPGQYAVFYKNDYVYGAGKIQKIELLDPDKE